MTEKCTCYDRYLVCRQCGHEYTKHVYCQTCWLALPYVQKTYMTDTDRICQECRGNAPQWVGQGQVVQLPDGRKEVV